MSKLFRTASGAVLALASVCFCLATSTALAEGRVGGEAMPSASSAWIPMNFACFYGAGASRAEYDCNRAAQIVTGISTDKLVLKAICTARGEFDCNYRLEVKALVVQ